MQANRPNIIASKPPSYLRIVVTTRCTLACPFCHLEGDPAQSGAAQGLAAEEIAELAGAAYDQGVRKIKLLGGEPLARQDIGRVIALLRQRCTDADLSLITAGVVNLANLQAAFDAGLDRANLSIHGWSPDRLAKHTRVRDAHARRQAVLEFLLRIGRPLKCNYVYTGPEVEEDLAQFLAWAAGKPLVVALLDDLGNPAMGPATVKEALRRLRGPWGSMERDNDPHSLSTLRLGWSDGLAVEIKDQQLGQVAPWRACTGCLQREQCREGIHAVRLKHDGTAAPCMDRPDLGRRVVGLRSNDLAMQWQSVLAA